MSTLQLDAQPRKLTGRKVRQLRVQGLVPVVVYGNIDEPEILQVKDRNLERTLQGGGTSQLVELQVEGGQKHNVLIRDIQRHPVRRTLIHADFYAVNIREKQQVTVSIVSVNQPESMAGGMLMLQAMDSIEIEALPTDIPAQIEIDITALALDNALTVADLPTMTGVEYLAELDEPIFTMQVTREEEEAVVDGDDILEEGAVPELVGEDTGEEEAEE